MTEKGSAVVIALIAVALAGLMIFATTTVTNQMITEATREQQKDAIDKFNLFVEAIATNPDTCAGIASSPMTGFTFVNPTSHAVGKDQYVLGSPTITMQEVRLPSNIDVAGGGTRVIKGADANDATKAVFDNFNRLTVDRFFIQNARQLDPNTYQVDLLYRASVGPTQFAPRNLGQLTLSFSAGSLSACVLQQSAQAMCEDMGCKFNITAPGQKCSCGFAEMSCPQTPGQPMNYIAGINTSTNPPTPICRSFKVSCLTKMGQPGYALTGINASGDPVCEAVEGSAGGPPPPTPPPSTGFTGHAQQRDCYTSYGDCTCSLGPPVTISCSVDAFGVQTPDAGSWCSGPGAGEHVIDTTVCVP